MLLSHQKFDFKGKTLIEKVKIRAPYRRSALFQNQGCFIYMTEVAASLNAPDQKIRIEARESVLLSCGQYFVDFLEQTQSNETEVYAIHLYPDMLKSIYAKELPGFITSPSKSAFVQKVASNEVVTRFIDSIDFYFQNPQIVNDDLLEIKIKELILILIQTKNAESVLTLIADLFNPKNVSLHQIVETHLYSKLSVENLADMSGMSLSTFKRAFRKNFGDSPTNYFNKRKIERALELLKLNGLTIAQVAYEVGYSDPAYFSRKFKKLTNTTPLDYRQNIK